MNDEARSRYYREAESWSADREQVAQRSRRLAWIVAAVFGASTILEAIALVLLVPLKTEVPYTLLVDRQTGYVQALRPLERQTITPDDALVRSFLAQYVIVREGYDFDSLQADYRKVALWSAGEARERYVTQMQPANSASPLATLPRQALIDVEVRSISSLGSDTALVRFSTVRDDPGIANQQPQNWVAVVRYRFSGDAMSAADRLVNPLGFQVLRYKRDAEMVTPQALATPAATYASASMAAQSASR